MSETTQGHYASGLTSDFGSEQVVTEMVKAFYEDIQFPGKRPMEQDSLIFMRKFTRLVDAHAIKGEPVRVLDAGCGTGNTSLALAAQFSDVSFTGVDLSGSSIARARIASSEQGLRNTRFYEWNLLQPLVQEQPFDIVLCFGALHHTAQMQKALHTISAVLKRAGTMFIWVYGAYGRFRHILNMELLAMLLDAAPVQDRNGLAHEFIHSVGDHMAAHDLLGARSTDPLLRPFFEDPTWIADQFLNPNEYSLSMRDIMKLLRTAGLRIDEWVGAPKDVHAVITSEELCRRYALLSEEKQLIALDLMMKADRYFLVLSKAEED
jgi:ubiquinone/menaquinone biosynthesis C-methylase UbiE